MRHLPYSRFFSKLVGFCALATQSLPLSAQELPPPQPPATLFAWLGLTVSLATLAAMLLKYRALKSDHELAGRVIEDAQDAIMITDAHGKIIHINPAFTRITGFNERSIIGQSSHLTRANTQVYGVYSSMEKALEQSDIWQGEVWNRRANGEEYPAWETLHAIRGKHHRDVMFVSRFNDISEDKLSDQQRQQLSHYDPLTRLPNRSTFVDRCRHALMRADQGHQRVALYFIGLDDFKWVNENLGMESGDKVLTETARRIEDCCQSQDIIGRLGGDEFVVHHPLDLDEDAEDFAYCLEGVINPPYSIDGQRIQMRASIGITIYPDHTSIIPELLVFADAALAQAKRIGPGRIQYFDAELQQQFKSQQQLEHDLRTAIQQRELFLQFQPKIAARSGVITGYEALLRWRHPQLGRLMPEEFIPMAEHIGLMQQISEQVIEMSARQIRLWKDNELCQGPIAVNLSPAQLGNPDLVDFIDSVIKRHRIRYQDIEIELTENLLMQHSGVTIDTLHTLKERGMSLAIDDFGSGYASLSYLQRLPCDTLKIDRSFIQQITSDEDSATIVKTIITLAHSLHLTVLAEGIETEQQLAMLLDFGCDEFQGYFFSAALTPQVLEQHLIKNDGNYSERMQAPPEMMLH